MSRNSLFLIFLISLFLLACTSFKQEELFKSDPGILTSVGIFYMNFHSFTPIGWTCSDLIEAVMQAEDNKNYKHKIIGNPEHIQAIDSLMKSNSKNIRSNFPVDSRLTVILHYSTGDRILCFGTTDIMVFEDKYYKKNEELFNYFVNLINEQDSD